MPYMMGSHVGSSPSCGRSGSPRRQAISLRHRSCSSQPMDVRSGSSPAVVITSTACWLRAASVPWVNTVHNRCPASPFHACISSHRIAEKEKPCLPSASEL